MGIAVQQFAPAQQAPGFIERDHDRDVGIALLAVLVVDDLAGEKRYV